MAALLEKPAICKYLALPQSVPVVSKKRVTGGHEASADRKVEPLDPATRALSVGHRPHHLDWLVHVMTVRRAAGLKAPVS